MINHEPSEFQLRMGLTRMMSVSPGIGAIALGVAEVAVVFVAGAVAGLLVHIAFANLASLWSLQRFAPIAATTSAAGVMAYWSQ